MKLLCVHAHFDDFEFVAGGTFDRFQAASASGVESKLIVCTDGGAGHHSRGLEETREMRWDEQQKACEIGGHAVERLQMPDGSLRPEGNPEVDRDFLAALWRAIRAFEPDYLFCPPIPQDALAGVHVDHVAVAKAVRSVAYMINVPHAYIDVFPEEDVPAEPRKTPVIINTYDAYMAGSNPYDFAVDVGDSFEKICEMAWCHQSQISEWLPWVGRHSMPAPKSFSDWRAIMQDRFERQNRELGLPSESRAEAFMVTAWGEVPSVEQLKQDFPQLLSDYSSFENLHRRLGAM